MTLIEWLAMNWKFCFFLIIMIFLLIYGLMTGKCIKWLEWAVTEAEKQLGNGTGALKLRTVYTWFVDQYPSFSVIVPFPLFEYWVNIALKWMKKQMEHNPSFNNIINGE